IIVRQPWVSGVNADEEPCFELPTSQLRFINMGKTDADREKGEQIIAALRAALGSSEGIQKYSMNGSHITVREQYMRTAVLEQFAALGVPWEKDTDRDGTPMYTLRNTVPYFAMFPLLMNERSLIEAALRAASVPYTITESGNFILLKAKEIPVELLHMLMNKVTDTLFALGQKDTEYFERTGIVHTRFQSPYATPRSGNRGI